MTLPQPPEGPYCVVFPDSVKALHIRAGPAIATAAREASVQDGVPLPPGPVPPGIGGPEQGQAPDAQGGGQVQGARIAPGENVRAADEGRKLPDIRRRSKRRGPAHGPRHPAGGC